MEGKEKQLAISTHPQSAYTFGRREGYLSANNIQSGLSEYGDAYLKRMALPQWGIQGTVVKFTDENGYNLKPLESFGIGDWIGWNIPPEGHDPVGFSDKVKVKGITASENDETGALEYTLDLNNTMLEHEIKMNQKVERFTQFSGSDVLSTPSSSSDGYSESEVNQLLQNKANKIHQHLFTDLADAPDSYTGQNGKQLMVNAQGTGLEFKPDQRAFSFYVGGPLQIEPGAMSILSPINLKIVGVRLCVDVAPIGGTILCDINLNGVTAYTTQANRPSILDGQTVAVAMNPDVVSVSQGQKVTLDIDSVGTTTAGSNLSLTVLCEVV